MKTKLSQNTKAIILGFILTLGTGYAAAEFAGPACAPPGCNADVPINASSSAQTKTGPLTLLHLFTPDFTFAPSGVTIAPNSLLVADGSTGRVKWQPVEQGYKMMCVGPYTAYATTRCCRVNVTNGEVICKERNDNTESSPWVNQSTPFPAGALGNYDIELTSASPGISSTMLCRSGNNQYTCKTSNAYYGWSVASWSEDPTLHQVW